MLLLSSFVLIIIKGGYVEYTNEIKKLLFRVVDCGIYAGNPPNLVKIGVGIQNAKTGELYSYSFKPNKKPSFVSNEEALELAQKHLGCKWSHAWYTCTDRKNEFHFISKPFKPNIRVELVNSYSNFKTPKYFYVFEENDTLIYTNTPIIIFRKNKFSAEDVQVISVNLTEIKEELHRVMPLSVGFINGEYGGFMPRWIYNSIPGDYADGWEQILHIAKICKIWEKSSFEAARDFCAAVFNKIMMRQQNVNH